MVESCSSLIVAHRRHKFCIVRFRVGTKSSLTPLFLLSPKSHLTFRGPRLAFSFSPVFQVHAFGAELCFGKMTKQKEPITQNIRNRREHRSRFKVMFYVIGSEKSKSGSAFYSSRQQKQRRGGAVRYFRCTDIVSDDSDLCFNLVEHFYSVVMWWKCYCVIIIQTSTLRVNVANVNYIRTEKD